MPFRYYYRAVGFYKGKQKIHFLKEYLKSFPERHFPISNGLFQVSILGVIYIGYTGYPFSGHR